MPRLRNIQTGAVMSVSDSTASRLGSEWVPADGSGKRKRRSSQAAPPPPADDGTFFAVSANSAAKVLEFVGDDVARAVEVLAVETSEDGKNRSSVVKKLEALIEAADAVDAGDDSDDDDSDGDSDDS